MGTMPMGCIGPDVYIGQCDSFGCTKQASCERVVPSNVDAASGNQKSIQKLCVDCAAQHERFSN